MQYNMLGLYAQNPFRDLPRYASDTRWSYIFLHSVFQLSVRSGHLGTICACKLSTHTDTMGDHICDTVYIVYIYSEYGPHRYGAEPWWYRFKWFCLRSTTVPIAPTLHAMRRYSARISSRTTKPLPLHPPTTSQQTQDTWTYRTTPTDTVDWSRLSYNNTKCGSESCTNGINSS